MEIQYSKQAVKFLNKQEKFTKLRIIREIEQLPQGDVKKLQGREEYRLRIGNYRIIFIKNGEILYVEKIDNRGQVYRR